MNSKLGQGSIIIAGLRYRHAHAAIG